MAASTPDAPPEDVLAGRDVAGRVMRGGLQRTVGFVAVNLSGALTAVVLLRHLGVADFGRYGTVMALLAIVQGVSDAGLTLTGSRELSVRRDLGERREVLGHLLGLRMLLTGAGVLVAIGFAAVAGYSGTLVKGTAIAGAGVFLISVQGAMLLPLVVELRNGRVTISEVMRQMTLLACFIVLVAVGAALGAFFVAQLVAAAILLALTPVLVGRRHLVAPRWARTELWALTMATLPLAVSAILSVLYFRLLVVLMSLLEKSPVEVGYYVTSARVMEIFLGLPVMLVGIVLPVLSVAARDDADRLNFVTLRTTQVLALLGVLFALVIAVGARPILTILGGSQYGGAASVLRIQCIALITIFTAGAWTTTLVSMGRTRVLAVGTAIGVVAVTALGAALIPPFGAQGAGVAAVAGDIIYCAAIFAGLRRAGPGRALPAGPFARIVLAAAPPLALALISPLPALADAVLVGLLFALTALLAGAVPEEIGDRVWRMLGRR